MSGSKLATDRKSVWGTKKANKSLAMGLLFFLFSHILNLSLQVSIMGIN